jgi:LysR family transcriptional activator of nhaA
MRLTRSTLSTQIRALEEHLGGELFLRSGRKMALTALGGDVLVYADDIFRTGSELVEMARARHASNRTLLRIGVVAGIPERLVQRLLAPVLSEQERGPLHIRQDTFDRLLDELTAGHLHLVLSDLLPVQDSTARVFAQTLHESTVWLHGAPELARRYVPGFPHSLDGAPFLLPSRNSHLRTLLERWFNEQGVCVRIEGEFDDAAMMRSFGLAGRGLFAERAPSSADGAAAHGLVPIGKLDGVIDRFYSISTQRKICRAELRGLLENGRKRRPQSSCR